MINIYKYEDAYKKHRKNIQGSHSPYFSYLSQDHSWPLWLSSLATHPTFPLPSTRISAPLFSLAGGVRVTYILISKWFAVLSHPAFSGHCSFPLTFTVRHGSPRGTQRIPLVQIQSSVPTCMCGSSLGFLIISINHFSQHIISFFTLWIQCQKEPKMARWKLQLLIQRSHYSARWKHSPLRG